MIVKKMRASFGKLRGTLELTPGMNLLAMPNEAGKSTWSTFLVAMLYGIDTSERANAQNQGLPAKERYKPWDGGPMEGAVELIWQGREITIERKTERRAPMGAFRAYETRTGAPVAELTGENCGQMLCGVERSVFERTAFIRQLGLAVTGDAALEKRLGALVSTGEEGAKSFSQLEAELKKYQNALVGRAGKGIRLENEAKELRQSLQNLSAMQEDAMDISAQVEIAREKVTALEKLQQQAALAKQAKQRAGLTELQKKAERQAAECDRLAALAQRLPPEAGLYDLQKELDAAQERVQTAMVEAAMGATTPPMPEVPPCFAGLTGAAAQKKAAEDAATWAALSRKETGGWWLSVLAALLALGGGAALVLQFWLPGGLALGAGLVAGGLWLRKNRATKKKTAQRQVETAALQASYGTLAPEEWTALAARYAVMLDDYAQTCQKAQETQASLTREVQAAQAALDALLARVRTFAPECSEVADAREALRQALHVHDLRASAARSLHQLRQQCADLETILGGVPVSGPLPVQEIDEAKVNYDHGKALRELERLGALLAARQGAISVMGDAVQLRARLEEVETRLEQVHFQAESAALAMDALKKADATLRARFSPQITADAGALLARMTAGKYPAVLLDPALHLSVREAEGTLMRPAAAMSCGTADQMYLALRLAMCLRLLPADVPLILDDALVNFDEARTAAALELLEQLAEHRQIIFFSCKKLR